jgi:D-threo-aldose 1-dehydrogenase
VTKLLLLDDRDNVLVCVAPIAAGETIEIDGAEILAPEPIALGHKVARRRLAVGDRVIKYGAPIGSMTAEVPIGAWVHMHVMKSDYIASHTRKTLRDPQDV